MAPGYRIPRLKGIPAMSILETGSGMSEVIFRAEAICKSYVSVRALNNVNLTIRRGEVHALLGQNGAGKSTLVKIIAGAQRPDSGGLFVDGQPLQAGDPDAAVSRRIAYVSQEGSLNPGFTVPENVFLGREKTRFGFLDSRRMQRATEEVLETFGLSLDLRHPVGMLDPAKRKLAEIVRALALRPRLLILDEPTASIDLAARHALWQIIRRQRDAGTTVLLTTHHLDEAEQLCDRIGILHQGRLLVEGTPAAIRAAVPAEQIALLDAADLQLLRDRAQVLGLRSREIGGRLGVLLPHSQSLDATVQHFADLELRSLALSPVTLEHAYLQLLDTTAA